MFSITNLYVITINHYSIFLSFQDIIHYLPLSLLTLHYILTTSQPFLLSYAVHCYICELSPLLVTLVPKAVYPPTLFINKCTQFLFQNCKRVDVALLQTQLEHISSTHSFCMHRLSLSADLCITHVQASQNRWKL